MDNTVNKTKIYSAKTAIDDFFEEKTEFDIVIPDYCPAASRILSCNVEPCLLSHSQDGTKFTIDIQVVAQVIYIDEDDCIHSIEKMQTMSRTLTMHNELDVWRLKNGVRPISVNCRMSNSRRISVRAVIGTALKMSGSVSVDCVSDEYDLQAVYKTVTANTFAGFGETVSHISGTAEVRDGITEVIKSGATVYVTDIKTVDSRAIVKGVAEVHIVYVTGEGTEHFCFAECSIPFSDIVSIDGAFEDCITQTSVSVSNVRCELNAEGGEVNVEADANISVSLYALTEMNLMCDAYSMKNDVAVNKTDVAIEAMCEYDKFEKTVSGNVSSDMEQARIIGITGNPTVKSISVCDDQLSIDGDMSLVIYMCNEDEYKISEKSIPFSFLREMPQANGTLRCEASSVLKSVSFNMPDDQNININATVEVELCCLNTEIYSVVSGVESSSESGNSYKGVVLYNAEKGERLWDIAKRYRSSVEIIKRDNSIDSDELDCDKMLLIAFN